MVEDIQDPTVRQFLQEGCTRAGLTYSEMSQSLGVSDRTVARWCSALGLQSEASTDQQQRPQRRPWQDPQTAKELERLCAEGLSYSAIAERLGCAPETIIEWCKKLQLTTTHPHPYSDLTGPALRRIRQELPKDTLQQYVAMVQQGHYFERIAASLGLDAPQMHDCARTTRLVAPKYLHTDADDLRRMLERWCAEGMSYAEMSNQFSRMGFNYTARLIRSRCAALGLYTDRTLRLTPDQDHQVRQMAADGRPANYIAAQLQLSVKLLQEYMEQRGITVSTSALYRIPPEIRHHLQQSAEQGIYAKAVAAQFGVSSKLIVKWAKMMGIELLAPRDYYRDAVLEQRARGATLMEIGASVGTSYVTVMRWIQYYEGNS